MGLSKEQRKELQRELNAAGNNCASGECNWCGSKNIEKKTRVMVSDLPRTLYECDDCGELTAKYQWNGTNWRAAIQDTNVSPTYTMIRGSK